MLSRAKKRAKEFDLDFDIGLEDLVWPKVCPVFNVEFDLKAEKRANNFSPSLDRIDNSKGYVKGNVRIISQRANYLKRDMSYEEAKKLLDNWNKTV